MKTPSPPKELFISETLMLELFSSENAGEYFRMIKENKSRLEDSFRVTLEELSRINTEDYRKLLLKIQDAGQRYIWLVRKRDHPGSGYIGMVNIHKIEKTASKCRLAYFIDQSAAGCGYGSLAVKAITTYCFEGLKMNKVGLRIISSNTASIKLAEKTGYRKAGLIRREVLTLNGVLKDAFYYEMLKMEFKS